MSQHEKPLLWIQSLEKRQKFKFTFRDSLSLCLIIHSLKHTHACTYAHTRTTHTHTLLC